MRMRMVMRMRSIAYQTMRFHGQSFAAFGMEMVRRGIGPSYIVMMMVMVVGRAV
jgi:hypothetical protein